MASVNETDREQVRRLLAGDESAFEAFFERAFPELYRFALAALGDPDAAEDAAQEALCAAMRGLATWRGEASLRTWLLTLARHEIGDQLRERQREPVALPLDWSEICALLEPLSDAADGPEADALCHEMQRLVQAVLYSLPEHYRDVLTWKYLEDLSVACIANRLEVNPKAVESRLTRAREAFRREFVALAREFAPFPQEPTR